MTEYDDGRADKYNPRKARSPMPIVMQMARDGVDAKYEIRRILKDFPHDYRMDILRLLQREEELRAKERQRKRRDDDPPRFDNPVGGTDT